MKYILKSDYDKGDFRHLIEAATTKELEKALGKVKGYGVDLCPDDRADGIVYVQN